MTRETQADGFIPNNDGFASFSLDFETRAQSNDQERRLGGRPQPSASDGGSKNAKQNAANDASMERVTLACEGVTRKECNV